MLEVHVPQGLEVRVLSWAPYYRTYMIALLLIALYFIIGFVGSVLYVRANTTSDTFDTENFTLAVVFWPIYGIIIAAIAIIERTTKFVEFLTNKKAV